MDECKFQHGSTGNDYSRRGKGKFKNSGGSLGSSGDATGTQNAGKGLIKNRCNLCNEFTDPPHWTAMCRRALAALKTQGASSLSSSTCVQQPISTEWQVPIPTPAVNDVEHSVSLASCLTIPNKNMPLTFSANMIRVHGTCMNQGVGCQRFFEYHTKKDTLMMFADMDAEIHIVCERHNRRLWDRTMSEGRHDHLGHGWRL